MIRTRLEIYNKDGSGYTPIPFNDNIPLAINYKIADIREPNKLRATRSYTITLLGANDVNILFENIFEVNISTQYFNKNLKSQCRYFVDEILNFEGSLQLIKINITPEGYFEYECSVIANTGNLFLDLGEKLISELDFSTYNHTYNRATQISTRSNTGTGLGVVYPFIDRGTNGGSETIFNTTDFIPCVHSYELIKKIIEGAGYTYTSSILTNSEYKKLVVLPNIDKITLSQTQLNNSQFNVGLNSNVALSNNTPLYPISFNNESTGGYFDTGSQYSAGVATIANTGTYNVVSSLVFKIRFTHANPSVNIVKPLIRFLNDIGISRDGGATYNRFCLVQEPYFGNWLNYNLNTDYYFTVQNASGPNNLNAGYKLAIATMFADYNSEFYIGGTLTTPGTINVELVSGSAKSSFYLLRTKKEISVGNTVDMQNVLPVGVKQKDYLLSELKRLNLQIDTDKDNPKHLIIEDYDTFYNSSQIVSYDNLMDTSKKREVILNLLDWKNYQYTYKSDEDKYNKMYFESFKEVYGTHNVVSDNEFKNETKKTELIFSATPNVANYSLGIAHPRIFKEEESGGVLIKKPIKQNIRLLYCSGVKQTVNQYTYREDGAADIVTNDYLYAGHTDDALSPTIDLNFGLPKIVYYSYINTYFTTNNSFNRFHKQFVKNLTHRDAKIERVYLWLNALEISKFSFRNRVELNGAYWICNAIENYQPINESSTLCEFVKLLDTDVFTPSQLPIDTDITMPVQEPVNRTSNTSIALGQNSTNFGVNSLIIGDNSNVEGGSNLLVVGNNINIPLGQSNYSVINGFVASSINGESSSIKYIDNNYTVLKTDETLTVNAAGMNITISLGSLLIVDLMQSIIFNSTTQVITKNITIKRLDSSGNTLTVSDSGRTIDGAASITLSSLQSVTLKFDGTNWIKI